MALDDRTRLLSPDTAEVQARVLREVKTAQASSSGAYGEIGTVVTYDQASQTAVVTVGTSTYTVSNFTGAELGEYYLVALNQLADGTRVAVGYQIGVSPLPDFGIPFAYNGNQYRVAPRNWDLGQGEYDATVLPWSITQNQSTAVANSGATSTTDGATNTRNIVSQNGNGSEFAAGLCSNYAGGGFTDWFLPSVEEFRAMKEQLAIPTAEVAMENGFYIGVQYNITARPTADGNPMYWTSTETAEGLAVIVNFNERASVYTMDLQKSGRYVGASPYQFTLGALVRPVRRVS